MTYEELINCREYKERFTSTDGRTYEQAVDDAWDFALDNPETGWTTEELAEMNLSCELNS